MPIETTYRQQTEIDIKDIVTSGTIDALDETVVLECNGISGAKAAVSGTWVGTIKFEQTIDDLRWDAVGSFSGTTGTSIGQTGITSNDIVVFVGVAGVGKIRARFHDYTSGSASVTLRASNGVSNVFVDNLVPANLKTQSQLLGNTGGLLADIVNQSGQNRLQVGTTITGISGGISASYSSKLRYLDMNVSNGGVARATSITNSTWVDVFSYTGSGLLTNFLINIEEGNNWRIRLLVDSEEVFESTGLLTTDLSGDSVYDLDPSGKSIDENAGLYGLFLGAHDAFRWSGPLGIPVKYNSSVVIKVKREAGASTKKFQAGLVILTKET